MNGCLPYANRNTHDDIALFLYTYTLNLSNIALSTGPNPIFLTSSLSVADTTDKSMRASSVGRLIHRRSSVTRAFLMLDSAIRQAFRQSLLRTRGSFGRSSIDNLLSVNSFRMASVRRLLCKHACVSASHSSTSLTTNHLLTLVPAGISRVLSTSAIARSSCASISPLTYTALSNDRVTYSGWTWK